ncbi:MAG: hypothetical protein WA902_20695 [Thermosynechococcaceae cyanobacterium]
MSLEKSFLQINDLNTVESLGLLDRAIENASARRDIAATETGQVIGGTGPSHDPGATCGMVCPDPSPIQK